MISRPVRTTDIHESCVEVDPNNRYYASPIDVAEREYRQRFQPSFTYDGQAVRPTPQAVNVHVDEYAVTTGVRRPAAYQQQTIDRCLPQEAAPAFAPARFATAHEQKATMGYYDEDGKFPTPLHGPEGGRGPIINSHQFTGQSKRTELMLTT
jgi:hypothetical protein